MTAPTHPLADLLAGVALTPDHEKVIAVLEETGYGPAAVSLLRTYAAHLAPKPTGLRSAHFAYQVDRPAGADPVASEGLPSYMAVGCDAEGPFWHCSRHNLRHFGQANVAHEQQGARDHVATYHTSVLGGGRRG